MTGSNNPISTDAYAVALVGCSPLSFQAAIGIRARSSSVTCTSREGVQEHEESDLQGHPRNHGCAWNQLRRVQIKLFKRRQPAVELKPYEDTSNPAL